MTKVKNAGAWSMDDARGQWAQGGRVVEYPRIVRRDKRKALAVCGRGGNLCGYLYALNYSAGALTISVKKARKGAQGASIDTNGVIWAGGMDDARWAQVVDAVDNGRAEIVGA